MNLRTALATLFVTVTATGALTATPAQADSFPVFPNKSTCGTATCTAYWSVDRTNEFQAEWKDTVNAAGGLSFAALEFSAVMAKSPWTAAIGLAVGARTAEFNHMINGAANDGRCLIYKYPKYPIFVGGVDVSKASGWFGSVSLSNRNCDQGPA